MFEYHFFERIRKRPIPQPSSKKNKVASIKGAFTKNNKIFLNIQSTEGKQEIFESENGIDFQRSSITLPESQSQLLQLDTIDQGTFAILYSKAKGLGVTLSKNMKKWTPMSWIISKDLRSSFNNGVIVPNFQLDNQYLMLLGGRHINLANSSDGIHWKVNTTRFLKFPTSPDEEVHVDFAKRLSRGLLIGYRTMKAADHNSTQKVFLALLDQNQPLNILWNSESPIWIQPPELGRVDFGGVVIFRSQIYSFWNTSKMGPIHVTYPIDELPFDIDTDHIIALERAKANPIIYPRYDFFWESFATYNPAAFYAGGKVHILYRAQGPDLISSIGYASSSDGIQIDERLEGPVYTPREVFESYNLSCPAYVNKNFMSGGGIAGCEDPRTTVIDDRVYMTYVAFDGANPPRAALTTIDLNDFLAKEWKWSKPVLISQPGIVNKSAVIFPEKIKGKYVIMHRIFPHIQIDYVDHLNFDGSWYLQEKDRIPIRENMWDSRKIGAGAPPIKTAEGWLLIYYGVDDRDDRTYKMGAMVLDLQDPTKVLYRSSTPVLEPQDWYENSGFKPGIIYPCGAVVVNETLHVYYGGADCVVCVASRNLKSFLEALKSNHEIRLKPQKTQRMKPYATHSHSIQSYSFA